MELIQAIPFIRFANTLSFSALRGPSKTYDSRLFYTLKGEAELLIEKETVTLKRGVLVLFQPGTLYQFQPKGEITMAVFDFDFTQEWAARTAFLPPCPAASFVKSAAHGRVSFSDAPSFSHPMILENGAFAESKLQEIIQEFHLRHLFFKEKSSTLFKEVLFDLARTKETGVDAGDVIVRLFQYVDEHIGENVTNGQIGAALFYNPNYLNRLTLRNTGMSLHRYVLQMRLNRATKLLLTTRKPVGEIAAELGFHSASHFSNFFKNATGATPARFRKNGAV